MVADDLSNCLFFLQHCLLALLCQLKEKQHRTSVRQEQTAKYVAHLLFVSGFLSFFFEM